MSENNSTSVSVVFEFLLDAIETEMDAIDQVGAEAFEGRDYDSARETLERADQLKAFREKIVALRVGVGDVSQIAKSEHTCGRRSIWSQAGLPQSLAKGIAYTRTSFLSAYFANPQRARWVDQSKRCPGATHATHERDVEGSRLSAPPIGEIRWRKTANWARDTLVKKGR